MNTKKYDLTEGNILRRLLLVAAPLMGTQVLQMAYNLTDLIWLGRVHTDAVASVGTAGMYMWLSMAFLMTGRMGAEIGVSQFMGRSDLQGAKSFSQNALFLALVSGVTYALFVGLLRHPLIGVFAIREAHVAQGAADYLGIVALGMPAMFISGAISGTFNGVGNSRIPFLVNGFGIVLNMILTPIFIFTLDFGLHGAAWSTVISQMTVVILAILCIRFFRIRPFDNFTFFVRPNLQRIKQIFRWTIPISIESGAFTLLSMVVGRFVAAFGANALAVQRIGIQIESISWMLAMGFASALTAFVGQNYGRGCWSRIHRGARLSLFIMGIWGIVTMVIPLLFGRQLFALFIPGEPGAVLEEGVRFLRILAVCQIFICLEFWAVGIFRGLGRTIPPTISTIIGNSIRVPLAYFLSLTPLGVAGLWWGISLGAVIRGIILVSWYFIASRRLPQEDVIPAGDVDASLTGAASS